MDPEVFIAGVGAITAIGNNVAECLCSFEKEQAGMADIAYIDTVHRHNIPVAEVKLSNKELAEMAGISAATSRTTLLGLIAAKEASVSYTHLRAHETDSYLVCRLLLEKKK